MIIECKRYSAKEFYTILGISRATWNRRQEEILTYLKEFIDYSVERKGRYVYYTVNKQYQEWDGLPKKTELKEKQEFYKEQTHQVIDKDPWNTGVGVARTIVKTNNKFNHKARSAVRYVSPVLKQDFLISKDKKWVYKDENTEEYIDLNEEQVKYLTQLLNKTFENNEDNLDIIEQLHSGYITREEAGNILVDINESKYISALTQFRVKYKVWPISIHKYDKKMW